MTSKPEPDERLIGAHDLALQALHEITPASTVGPAAGYLLEDDGTVSLRFENRLPGYPGWHWIVTVARVDDAEPTVLEVELLPGDGALLAPEWVPWAERLAEYRAHQAELAEQAAAADATGADASAIPADADDDSDADDDLDELDDDELDESGSALLHAGDLDGVDIDELDESADADDDDDSDDDLDDEDTDDEGSDDEDDSDVEDSDDEDDEDSDDEDSGDDEGDASEEE